MKTILIIPCYNDNEQLKGLLASPFVKASKYDFDVLVIDDGSFKVVSDDISETDFELIRNDVNKGKGFSIRKGLSYALKNKYSHAITLDADLQHDPNYISEFIQIDKDVDVVLGNRSFGKDMPFLRRVSNRITSFIVSFLTGKKVLDSQSGYRRYKLDTSSFSNCLEDGFQFESEILINDLRKKRSTLSHVSIPTLYGSEKSSINNILDTYKFIKLILRKIIAR